MSSGADQGISPNRPMAPPRARATMREIIAPPRPAGPAPPFPAHAVPDRWQHLMSYAPSPFGTRIRPLVHQAAAGGNRLPRPPRRGSGLQGGLALGTGISGLNRPRPPGHHMPPCRDVNRPARAQPKDRPPPPGPPADRRPVPAFMTGMGRGTAVGPVQTGNPPVKTGQGPLSDVLAALSRNGPRGRQSAGLRADGKGAGGAPRACQEMDDAAPNAICQARSIRVFGCTSPFDDTAAMTFGGDWPRVSPSARPTLPTRPAPSPMPRRRDARRSARSTARHLFTLARALDFVRIQGAGWALTGAVAPKNQWNKGTK